MEKGCRVFFVLGATGGHIYPAIALQERLAAKIENSYFFGSSFGLEKKILTSLGYEKNFHSLVVRPFNGVSFYRKVISLMSLLVGSLQSCFYILKYRPNLVIGFGGFVSVPMIFTCRLMGVKTCIWEANMKMGLANKVLARWVHYRYSAFSVESAEFKKFKSVGVPVREKKSTHRGVFKQGEALRVLVLGGSQGASALNEAFAQMYSDRVFSNSFDIRHQVGYLNYEAMKKYDSNGVRIYSYFDDIYEHYQWAHIVVCRAGALTLAELTCWGIPSILVPAPHVADNHQFKNAQAFVDIGASYLIEEKDLNSSKLMLFLNKVTPTRWLEMCACAKAKSQVDPWGAFEKLLIP